MDFPWLMFKYCEVLNFNHGATNTCFNIEGSQLKVAIPFCQHWQYFEQDKVLKSVKKSKQPFKLKY